MTETASPAREPADRVAPLGVAGLIGYSVLMLAPALAAFCFLDEPLQDTMASVAFSLALWAFWLALWGRPLRGCVMAAPLLLVVPVSIYLLIAYRTPLNPSVLAIVLETNVEESRQFLHDLWLQIGLAYGGLLVAAAAALHFLRRHDIRWAPRWRFAVLGGVPLIFVALHLTYQPLETAARDLVPVRDPLRVPPWPLEFESVGKSSPFGMVVQLAHAIDAELRIAQVNRALAGFRFGAHQSAQVGARQAYVLVIGESARKDRWSLYGYARPTSPRLQQESNLIVFGDAITVAPATRVAVPALLTRAHDPPERSLVSAFREAGFATYWLSTQAPVGTFDAAYARYAKEAEHTRYFNPTGDWALTPPDGVMLDSLRRVLAVESEPRQLIVVHTLGSHIEYRKRYPDAFDVFKPSLRPNAPLFRRDAEYLAEINNTYDNTILYTDYFLDSVIGAVKASGRAVAAVMYLSDHGEDMPDDGCGYTAHGKATLAGLRIPFFFWFSSDYLRTFPDKVARLQEHRDAPLNSEAIFPTLIDAADIHFASEDLRRSVASASFVPLAKRNVQAMGRDFVDYDRAHLNGECLLVNN